MASRVPLTTAEQLSVAGNFSQEEQAIAAAIRSGKSRQYIDSLTVDYRILFGYMLPVAKRNSYYEAQAGGKAATIARLQALVQQQRYHTDTTLQRYFSNMYTWQGVELEKIWNTSADTISRNTRLLNAIRAYDSLIGNYTAAARAGYYFYGRLHFMDSIMAIPELRKAALSAGYFNNCMAYPTLSYADNFSKAFNTVFNSVHDTTYYAAAYADQLKQEIPVAARNALAGYLRKENIGQAAASEIYPLLLQRERAALLAGKLYPVYTPQKDSLVVSILNTYQPGIDSILNLYVTLSTGSQLDVAIKYALQLSLTDEQVTGLKDGARELADRQREYRQSVADGQYESSEFESKVLNELLTPEQYTQVLTLRYAGNAVTRMLQDWKVITEAGIDTGLDSTQVKTELTNYHLATLVAYYRNANNKEEQYSSVKRLQEVMPAILRTLIDKWNYKTPYADTPDTFMQW